MTTVPPISPTLMKLAEATGYSCNVVALVYVKGWPQPSTKPYQIGYADGGHIASFADQKTLERNLRGRAGC